MDDKAATAGEARHRVVLIQAEPPMVRASRACARHMAAVTAVRGCVFGCRFCPEKFRDLQDGTIGLAADLPESLSRAIRERTRADTLPREVLFNPGADPFQPIPSLLSVVHESLRILLEAGVHVSIKTRGAVPEGFEDLFSTHRDRLSVDVAVMTVDERLRQTYEPGGPRTQERLDSLRRLVGWGVGVRARIEPMIPFVTDTAGHLEELVRHLRSVGVERAVCSYFVLKPRVLDRMRDSLPRAHFQLIKGSFKGRGWQETPAGGMTKLMPAQTRKNGYERLSRIAAKNDLQLSICACQNPEMGRSCHPPRGREVEGTPEPVGQLNLFKSA